MTSPTTTFLDGWEADFALEFAVEPCATEDHDAGVRDAPRELVDFVYGVAKKKWIANLLMDDLERKFLRRLRSDSPRARQARWAKRWRPEEQGRTKAAIVRQLGRVLRQHHRYQVSGHERFEQLPKNLRPWRPDAQGRLVVRDPKGMKPSIGSPSFMEATPVKLLRWAHMVWKERQPAPGHRPRIWDLTAGSGTSIDYFRHLMGCPVVASDLVAVLATGVIEADMSEVGRLLGHGAPRRSFDRHEAPVGRPDIVLIDPPSRGRPHHTDLYIDENDLSMLVERRPRDLGRFSRDEWIHEVVEAAARSVDLLADGGFISLLVRCGVRDRGRVIEDPDLLTDVKSALAGRARISHELPLVFATRTQQAGLGKERVPAVHLLIERAQ